jgi:hypothetical protein
MSKYAFYEDEIDSMIEFQRRSVSDSSWRKRRAVANDHDRPHPEFCVQAKIRAWEGLVPEKGPVLSRLGKKIPTVNLNGLENFNINFNPDDQSRDFDTESLTPSSTPLPKNKRPRDEWRGAKHRLFKTMMSKLEGVYWDKVDKLSSAQLSKIKTDLDKLDQPDRPTLYRAGLQEFEKLIEDVLNGCAEGRFMDQQTELLKARTRITELEAAPSGAESPVCNCVPPVLAKAPAVEAMDTEDGNNTKKPEVSKSGSESIPKSSPPDYIELNTSESLVSGFEFSTPPAKSKGAAMRLKLLTPIAPTTVVQKPLSNKRYPLPGDLFQAFPSDQITQLSQKTGLHDHSKRPFKMLFYTDSYGRNLGEWFKHMSHKHMRWSPNSRDAKLNNTDFIWQSGATLNRPPSTNIGYKASLNCYLFGRGELDSHHAKRMREYTTMVFFVGGNDMSNKPRYGRTTWGGKKLAEEYVQICHKVQSMCSDITIFIVTPPLRWDIDEKEHAKFADTLDNAISSEGMSDFVYHLHFNLFEYGNSVLFDHRTGIHASRMCTYTGVFFWEWLNIISSWGTNNPVGWRPHEGPSFNRVDPDTLWRSILTINIDQGLEIHRGGRIMLQTDTKRSGNGRKRALRWKCPDSLKKFTSKYTKK